MTDRLFVPQNPGRTRVSLVAAHDKEGDGLVVGAAHGLDDGDLCVPGEDDLRPAEVELVLQFDWGRVVLDRGMCLVFVVVTDLENERAMGFEGKSFIPFSLMVVYDLYYELQLLSALRLIIFVGYGDHMARKNT